MAAGKAGAVTSRTGDWVGRAGVLFGINARQAEVKNKAIPAQNKYFILIVIISHIRIPDGYERENQKTSRFF